MRELAPVLRKDIQKTLSLYLENNSLNFESAIKDISIGDIVMHQGNGSRNGWIGVISSLVNNRNRLDVIWMLDGLGKELKEDVYRTDSNKCFGKIQSYSLQWLTLNCYNNGMHKNYKNLYSAFYRKSYKGSLLEFDPKDPKNVTQRPPNLKPEVEYIIWSPNGTSNPKVRHTCKKVATKVAVDMSIKHDKDFYVCELVVKTEPLKKAKVIQL